MIALELIDVSTFQGDVDWRKVAGSGIIGAICRATIGLHTDSTFLANYHGARAAGLLVGAYHAYETSHDPVAQAQNFANVAGNMLDLAPFLDFEGGIKGIDRGHALHMGEAFCNAADLLFVKTCGLYTYPDFWDRLTGHKPEGTGWCEDRPFWLARYPGTANPAPLWPFSSVDLHQYSGTSTDVPGIPRPCDRDRFYGTIDELRAMGAYMPALESGPAG